MLGLGMESIYIGYSVAEFVKIKEILIQNKIPYKDKVRNRNAAWLFPMKGTVRSYTGSIGMNADYEHEYEILVKREDADEARYLIREGLQK